jgi:hypothetical protein
MVEDLHRERARVLGKAATLMLDQRETFARLATLEMGKRIAESRGEVEFSASILKYYADHAEKFLAPRPLLDAERRIFQCSKPPICGFFPRNTVNYGSRLSAQKHLAPQYEFEPKFTAPNRLITSGRSRYCWYEHSRGDCCRSNGRDT